jgi:sugar phosphate isomerase/epimerase
VHIGARAHSIADVEFLAQARFDFAEIDLREPGLVRQQQRELAALHDRYGITYLAHGPNEGNPFDVSTIARVLGPRVCALIEMAPELGIHLFTQHLWLDVRFVGADVLAGKADMLGAWLDCANRAGVVLCIENLSEHADHFAAALARLPDLCLTLDLGHGQILSSSNAAFDLIARYSDRVRHVHLHDNRGGDTVRDDLHLPLGQGRVDFPGLLGALRATGYDAGLCLEIALEHVAEGRELVRGWWNATVEKQP